MNNKKKHVGSNFEDFLKEENLFDNAEAVAIKRVISYQLEKAMKQKHLTKAMMAKKMQTSRSAVERLFDPENDSVTLITLNKAAAVLDKKLKIEII